MFIVHYSLRPKSAFEKIEAKKFSRDLRDQRHLKLTNAGQQRVASSSRIGGLFVVCDVMFLPQRCSIATKRSIQPNGQSAQMCCLLKKLSLLRLVVQN